MPKDWKIMTKVEHTKRTNEYLELLKNNCGNSKRKRDAPVIDEKEDTATKDMSDFDAAPENAQVGPKKKRKRKRNKKSTMADHVATETEHSHANQEKT